MNLLSIEAIKMKYAKISLVSVMLAGLAVVSGCASQPPAKPQDIVQARAQERVNLLLKRDFDKAYTFLAPSYRSLNSVENYRNSFGNNAAWVDPKVVKVQCPEPDRCQAAVEVGVRVAAPGFGSKPIPSTMWETWILEDGQWWFYQPN
ncbi:MAG: hypothetical protein JSS01_18170 [Proteobacteria bacterium]|nr:hypothetical protein [Pseudomonadota bacterium]